MTVIELTEEETKEIPRPALSEDEGLSLYRDDHFDLEFPNPANGHCYRLRSRGWIGHIPVSEITLVRVTPKVPVTRIFRMLEVAYNLKTFAILEGATHVDSLEELYERVASILARRVLDRARKGLFRTYVERRDDLAYVRGRIDIRGNLRNVLSGSPRIHCQYRELTADLEDNQILLWTLYLTSRLGLRQAAVQQEVRQAFRTLAGTVSLLPHVPADCVGRLYHRLNEDYQPLHGLCRFLLENIGPDIGSGSHEFLPFTLNMPNLFESFVAKWLNAHLPPELTIKAQHRVALRANAQLTFIMDLVLQDRLSGSPLAVLDTKYKIHEEPSEADIQQVVAYAVELGVEEAYLVYPSALSRPIEAKVGSIRVRSATFDLALDQDVAGGLFLDNLLRHSSAASVAGLRDRPAACLPPIAAAL
jgi:5-methylcytosine-specific restriction enzyme subunit McrC